MRKIIYLLFAVLLLQFSCALIPNISFQQENFQKQETIIGEIHGVLADLTRDDLKIYEDRREVLFEKNIAKFNGVYYFYIIPPKVGTFKLQISNILYNDNGLKSLNFEKILVINDSSTEVLTIRPGVYSGFNPEIFLINSGNESLDVEINAEKTVLSPGSSIKKTINSSYGISYLHIKSYKDFDVPIINLKISDTVEIVNETDNQTIVNGTENVTTITASGLLVPEKLEIQKVIDNEEGFYFEITNIGIQKNITIKNTNSVVSLTNYVFFAQNQTTIINLSINTTTGGVYSGKIEFYLGEEKINFSRIDVYVFANETNQEEFNTLQNSSLITESCSDSGGFLCADGENCGSENIHWSTFDKNYCCPIKCTKEGEVKKDSSLIIIGILSFVFIGAIVYFIYRRSKKIKNLKPEDRFKEVDKKYQNKFENKK